MSPAPIIELCSAALLSFYVVAGLREGARGWRRRLLEAAVLAAGAVVGEEICMRLYGAYGYDSGWTFWIDRLPLSVALTWPVVILSGRAVASLIAEALPGEASLRLPLWTGLVVWFDASLIEPIATHAGLWRWNLPGPFNVPLIGPLGWGFYAAAGALCLQRLRGWRLLWGVLLAPLLAHVLILATWWGALRWLPGSWPLPLALAAGFTVCACATALALRVRRSARLPWREAAPRACAAALFFALLGVKPDWPLALFALAFSPPYLALLPDLRFDVALLRPLPQAAGEGKPRQKARK